MDEETSHSTESLAYRALWVILCNFLLWLSWILFESYDMGTGKNYSSGTSYTGYSGYKGPAPSYNRSYSYDPKPKYTPNATVVDKIKKFSSMEPKYGHTEYKYPSIERSTASTDYKYPPIDRSAVGKDRYSSLDRYSNRSGYTSDYGGGTPYGSWDRASNRSNKSYGGSREGSPVSTRSSRYDYSSSASPYSTYSSYKSGSDASPVPKRPYERQSSRGYDPSPADNVNSSRRTSTDPRYSLGSVPAQPSAPLPRRRESITDESDDSAPEAEKREAAIRYLICRGTSPPPDPEAPKRENIAKERISVSRTRRIKVPDRTVEKRSRRQTVIEKGPSVTDCATQTNLDQPQNRRSRISSSAGFAGGGGGGSKGSGGTSATQPGETFYKYRDKLIGGPAPTSSYSNSASTSAGLSRNSSRSTLKDSDNRRSYKEETVSTPPAERSWRQSVYGEPPPPSRPSSRRSGGPADDEMSMSSSKHQEEDDDLSSRHGRRRRDPRTSTPSTVRAATPPKEDYTSAADDKRSRRSNKAPSRSSSREDVLDERPRRKRHSSKELLDTMEPEGGDESVPLTTENISLRHSIEKVKQWRQNLPSEGEPHIAHSDSYDYLAARDHLPPQTRDPRHNSPSHSRDNSPSRRARRHAGGSTKKHTSRSASNDSLLGADEEMPHDARLPNKDFRKSDLNRAEFYDQESDVFDREPSPEVRRSRGHRISDSYGKDSQAAQSAGQRVKRSGSSSDQAFSRDDSPNRIRHNPTSRQSSIDQHRANRDSSRENVLDERCRSRREQYDNNVTEREDSPGRHRNKHGRTSRQNSREDVLDDRGNNSNRRSSADSRKRPNQLGIDNTYDDSSKHGKLPPSTSQHSLTSATSAGTLPDIVPQSGDNSPQESQQRSSSQQYKGSRSGFISTVQDIDTLLTEERHHARPNHHILDSPVPQTPHHPLKPSPVQSPPPRPNSYAFENADQPTKRPAGSMRQSKSLGDKLIDIDDERVNQDKTSQPRAGHPPSVGGQTKKVPLSATAQQMWSILQSKKGLVTISDFLALCEKPPKRKLIQVGGVEEEERSSQAFDNATDMLESLGVDVHKDK